MPLRQRRWRNSTDFLRPHRAGRLDVLATPIHQGNTQQLWQVEIGPRTASSSPPARSACRTSRLGNRQRLGRPAHARARLVYPPIPASAATKLPGREALQAIADGRLPPPPIASLLGAELVSVGDGEAVFRIIPDERIYNPVGMVHGGLLCTMLDSAAGCAVQTLLPACAVYRTVEIKVSFLGSLHADGGPIEVRGQVLRGGEPHCNRRGPRI